MKILDFLQMTFPNMSKSEIKRVIKQGGYHLRRDGKEYTLQIKGSTIYIDPNIYEDLSPAVS